MYHTSRYLLAAALFVSWATLLAAWQLAPAIMMSGQNYSQPASSFLVYRSEIGSALLIPAWIAFLGALGVLLPPLLSRPRPDDGRKLPPVA